MKKLFQISFALIYLFLLNGNGYLYAHTSKANEMLSFEKSFESTESIQSDSNNSTIIPTLEKDSFPSGKKKSKRFKFSFFEKEETEKKEDKSTSFEKTSNQSTFYSFLFEIPLFQGFYHYDKNYLHVSESLTYFLFHKCYVLFRVFRL